MSPVVPLETQWAILSCLHCLWTHSQKLDGRSLLVNTDTELTLTLKACALVCRAWYPPCRRFLMEDVCLSSRDHLRGIRLACTRSPGIVNFKKTKTCTLKDPHAMEYPSPFHHLFLHYFSKDLSSLERLQIIGNPDAGTSRPLPCLPQLCMHLAHLHNLRHLMLQNYHFATFWDLRRLLVSPPSLTSVILAGVTWPAIHRASGLPSHISAASKILDVISIEVSSFWDVLLIWAIPTLRLSKWSTGHPTTEQSPTLRRDDVAIFERLLETTTGPAKSLKFTWKYGKDGDKWDLRSGWLTQSPVVALRMSVPSEVAQLTPSSQKAIAVVHSLHYQATFDDTLPSSEWAEGFDTVVGGLQALREVHLVFRCIRPWGRKRSAAKNRTQVKQMAEAMPSLRGRAALLLTFRVDGEQIPWM